MSHWSAFFFVVLATIPPLLGEEPGNASARTLSPYFLVKNGDPAIDRLPLEATSVNARIVAMFAEVTVTQVYKNDGQRTLEAVYVFPASTRAAVHGMRMKIGERTIVAEIREREEADREYQQALDRGATAGLLEQNRPNVFQMNLGNIVPGDRIEVQLEYSELLEPALGVYEFVYPTVVAPRYSRTTSAKASSAESWVANPYTRLGEPPSSRFDIAIHVAAAMPIQEIDCQTHRVQTKFNGTEEVALRLDPSEDKGGDRDFVVRYRLAGDGIASGLMVEEGGPENYFLLMLQPPRRIRPEEIPPREYIFVIDVSGSMTGFPHDTSIELFRQLVRDLRPQDSFNVLFFAGASFLLSESSLPATPANLLLAMQQIESRGQGGGTELLPALRLALAIPRNAGDPSRSIVVVTDGFVHLEREVFQVIRDHLDQSNIFAFGIGATVNRYLIEGIARAGLGRAFVVTDSSQAAIEVSRFREYVSTPVLTDIHSLWEGGEAYDVEPLQVPDLFSDRPIVVLGKWRGNPGQIGVEGVSPRGVWKKELPVRSAWRVPAGILGRLWARRRLAVLDDYGDPSNPQTKEAVTELGLRYTLLTRFTSFVAIDTAIRDSGVRTRVEQPLPLPRGFTDAAETTTVLSNSVSVLGLSVHQREGRVVQTSDSTIATQAPAKSHQSAKERKTTIRIAGGAAAKRLLLRVEPELPERALRARVAGIVLLEVKIDSQGNVERVKLIRGHRLLKKAAIEAVKQWKYEPYLVDGQAVPVITTVTVQFELQ